MSAAERVARSGPQEPTDQRATTTAALAPTTVASADGPTAPVTDLPADVRRLMRERHRLAVALRRYGRHDTGCDAGQACTCGLGPILDEAERR